MSIQYPKEIRRRYLPHIPKEYLHKSYLFCSNPKKSIVMVDDRITALRVVVNVVHSSEVCLARLTTRRSLAS